MAVGGARLRQSALCLKPCPTGVDDCKWHIRESVKVHEDTEYQVGPERELLAEQGEAVLLVLPAPPGRLALMRPGAPPSPVLTKTRGLWDPLLLLPLLLPMPPRGIPQAEARSPPPVLVAVRHHCFEPISFSIPGPSRHTKQHGVSPPDPLMFGSSSDTPRLDHLACGLV